MTDSTNNNNGDAPQINIIPADSHGDILVQLIRGQERAATALELQNRRLFGGDGQQGSIPALFKLQQDLVIKLDANKDELVGRIEKTKEVLSEKMVVMKREADADVQMVAERQNKLDSRLNWYAGGIATIGSAATLVMGYLGLRARAGH